MFLTDRISFCPVHRTEKPWLVIPACATSLRPTRRDIGNHLMVPSARGRRRDAASLRVFLEADSF
jgi:hypothetical protein